MRKWQRDIEVENYRNAQKPCTCGNNEDLCVSCEAREAQSKSRESARQDALYRQARREYDQP